MSHHLMHLSPGQFSRHDIYFIDFHTTEGLFFALLGIVMCSDYKKSKDNEMVDEEDSMSHQSMFSRLDWFQAT